MVVHQYSISMRRTRNRVNWTRHLRATKLVKKEIWHLWTCDSGESVFFHMRPDDPSFSVAAEFQVANTLKINVFSSFSDSLPLKTIHHHPSKPTPKILGPLVSEVHVESY